MSTIEVIALAGGRGSRMGHLTEDRQKCLLEIEGKPILGHLMDTLVDAFGSVDLKVGVCYKASQVINFLRRNKPKNVSVEFFICEQRGGEWHHFQKARSLIKGDFITAPGDVLALPEAYQNAITIYKQEQVDGLITLSPDIYVVDTHGVAKVINGIVVDLRWPSPAVVEQGYYRDMTIWPGDIRFFKLMDEYPMPGLGMSWVYMKALKGGRIVKGNIYTKPWLHLAHPEDLNNEMPR